MGTWLMTHEYEWKTNYSYLVGGLEHEVYVFPYIGKNNPNSPFFFRGVQPTNQLLDYCYELFVGW